MPPGRKGTRSRQRAILLLLLGRALPPREAASVAEARQWLGNTPNLIGYLDRTDLTSNMRILIRLP